MINIKTLLVLFIGFTLILAGCTADNAAHVNSETPINVSVAGGSITSNVTVVNTLLPVDISQSDSYLNSIAEKQISGHSTFYQLGYNGAVSTTEEDLWFASGPYVFPAAPQRMIVSSSSVADNATGTGVQKVIIYYLDDTYAEQSEIVTMNGPTFVSTVAVNILRVNGFRAYSTGTGYKAAGHITLSDITDTIHYCYIGTGYTRARNSAYTVPLGKTLYINNFYAGVSGLNSLNECQITLKATYNDASDLVLTAGFFFMPFAEVIAPNGTVIRDYDIPIRFPATTDIKVSAKTDVGTAIVDVSYRGWIEDD